MPACRHRRESSVPRYIALLRAINVGGHIVRMADLRRYFERMPFEDVETFIASGNVIFRARSRNTRKLESEIAGRLEAILGYEVATFVRTPAELDRVAARRVFPAAQVDVPGSSVYVIFVAEPPDSAARRRLQALRTDIDDFRAQGREIYRYCRGRLLDSFVGGRDLATAIGQPATSRNVTTVRRLVATCEGR